MSVRRLAAEAVQPKDFAFTAQNVDWAKGQIAKYPPGRQASAVIPLLWKAQEQAGGWTPRKAIEEVAAMLDLPFIRVMEIATFYTMFNLAPVGRHHVQLCGTVPCHVCGALELKRICEERIGPQGAVTADGNFSWIEVECLGACCNAPMVQINYDYYEDLDAASFGKLLDDLAAGRPVKSGVADRANLFRAPRRRDYAHGRDLVRRFGHRRLEGAFRGSGEGSARQGRAGETFRRERRPCGAGLRKHGSRAPACGSQGSRRGARGLTRRQCRARGRARCQGCLEGGLGRRHEQEAWR